MGARGFCFILGHMKEQQAFSYLGDITNIGLLVSLVTALSDDDWREYKERKSNGGIAGGVTDTIPLIYDEEQRINSNIQHRWFETFRPFIENVVYVAQMKLGPLSINQAMLTRLEKSSHIRRHKDMGPITAKTHRIHVPICTSEKCIFTVGDTSMSLPSGQIWLIDNVGEFHSVSNNGDSPRIHLIIDAR